MEEEEEEVDTEEEEAGTLVVVVVADLVTEETPGLEAVIPGLTTERLDSAAEEGTAGLVVDSTAAAVISRRDLETPVGAVALAVPVQPHLAVAVQEEAGISRVR